MTSLALLLVILSAFGHSIWNYLTKSSRYKVTFLWLMLLASGIIYCLPFWYRVNKYPIPIQGWKYIFATVVIHSFYFTFLGLAYRRGDLSTVYPIARGITPALIPFLAFFLLREFPSTLGGVGIVLIVAGVQIVSLPGLTRSSLLRFWQDLHRGPVGFAFLTGLMTTFYTLVDRQGVQIVDPFVYIYLQMVLTGFVLMPWMIIRRTKEISYEWKVNKWRVGAVGLLCVGAYLMVLSAMRLPVKVSYVAAVRECSIIFSTLLGLLLLRENRGLQKLLCAIIIVVGIICISLAK